jgi:molybdopterin synthase sulfur carrier subunit
VARLRLFAAAREAAGRGADEIDAGTVAEVLSGAVGRYGPGFEAVLGTCKIWLNGHETDPSASVGAGDEVAVLPPVSGGWG